MASTNFCGSLAVTVGAAILASICFGSPNDHRSRRDAQPGPRSTPTAGDPDTLRLSDLAELRERRVTDLRITDAKYDPENRAGLRREAAAEAATRTTGERARRAGTAAAARTGTRTYEEMRKRKKDRGLLVR